MKSCAEQGKRHQISADEKIDKCIFCQKTKREILDDMEAFDEPDYNDDRIGCKVGLDTT